MVTVEEYKRSKKIFEDHKICSGTECGKCCGDKVEKLFENKDVTKTVYYGTVKYWCKSCHERNGDKWKTDW